MNPAKSGRTPGTCTDESLRILRAARDGRLQVNEHLRYVIDGEPRPKRKDRENLQRWGFLEWRIGESVYEILLSPAGRSLLEAAERERGL